MLGHSTAVETKIDIYIENGPNLTMLPGIFVWLFAMAPLNVEHEYHWSQRSHLCQPHSDPLSDSSSASLYSKISVGKRRREIVVAYFCTSITKEAPSTLVVWTFTDCLHNRTSIQVVNVVDKTLSGWLQPHNGA